MISWHNCDYTVSWIFIHLCVIISGESTTISDKLRKNEYKQCATVHDQFKKHVLTKRLSLSAAHTPHKPEWHKTAFRTFIIQMWSCTVKALKPVPAVAGYKPLCFLKRQETQPKTEPNTHSEDFFRLPTCSHVGVVYLFEDHPAFIMLPHLTGVKREVRKRRCVQRWPHLFRGIESLTTTLVYSAHEYEPLISPRWTKMMGVTTTVSHFTSKGNYPTAESLLSQISKPPFYSYKSLFWDESHNFGQVWLENHQTLSILPCVFVWGCSVQNESPRTVRVNDTAPWCSISQRHNCIFKTVYLEVESGAFRHEGKSHHSTHTGQGTDDHKHPPTVKLVRRAHTEAPTCKQRRTAAETITSDEDGW